MKKNNYRLSTPILILLLFTTSVAISNNIPSDSIRSISSFNEYEEMTALFAKDSNVVCFINFADFDCGLCLESIEIFITEHKNRTKLFGFVIKDDSAINNKKDLLFAWVASRGIEKPVYLLNSKVFEMIVSKSSLWFRNNAGEINKWTFPLDIISEKQIYKILKYEK